MIDFRSIPGMPGEVWPRLRQAIQTAVAVSATYGLVYLFDLPQGFWAVMTAILVTQANVGASLKLAGDRLLGSLVGVLVGGAVAVMLAGAHELRFAGLIVTVLGLAFFAARRPSLRIACVTAAIVILGDPSLGSPIASARNRMLEVTIGTLVAIATTLLVFPSRAGPAFAEQMRRSLVPLFDMLDKVLAAALGRPLDASATAALAARVRAAFADGESLAKETRMEVAGHLAELPDPEAVLRALRRMWHTEIMLLRAVSQPLPPMVIEKIGPAIEDLRSKLDELSARFTAPTAASAPPDLSAAEVAFAEIEHAIEEMRARGEMRQLSMDEIIRLLAFDFALGQLRLNLRDLAEREAELSQFAGSSLPLLGWLRRPLRKAS